ncbi:PspC domain-containing protein [Tessaracoccus rhinocerotis]|uniref:PspC domain-containing protein n=1 Tax=Tessaracoccus rhinocerotis TaxID=1689449 RepID=A0A553K557_9ACTN|nr:PspC domain-containing protein [Tessaracoccus rhinocerotis]TRY19834.1 PspC domain-containing protein [Tessaracoccus rhinocerotis]
MNLDRRDSSMKLQRIDEGKWIAGVATGLSAKLGIDVTIVRIVFAAISVFWGGGIALYVLLWLIMPRPAGGTVAEESISRAQRWYKDNKRGGNGGSGYDI